MILIADSGYTKTHWCSVEHGQLIREIFTKGMNPFLAQHNEVPSIHELVLKSFNSFLQRNVMQYGYQQMLLHFIGSVAFYYQDILREAAQKIYIHIGNILKSPMHGLIEYHK